jgi:hypothetical protein
MDMLTETEHIVVDKGIANKLGLECAVLLGAFMNKQQSVGESEEFCYEENLIQEDTALKIYSIRKSKEVLKNIGILQIRKAGMPAKHCFRINYEALNELQKENK